MATPADSSLCLVSTWRLLLQMEAADPPTIVETQTSLAEERKAVMKLNGGKAILCV